MPSYLSEKTGKFDEGRMTCKLVIMAWEKGEGPGGGICENIALVISLPKRRENFTKIKAKINGYRPHITAYLTNE